ncbi:hypothetical protein HOL24_01335 [bacterium]|jgi:4-amino-4-deoxy-L-arabinose transferase-like glycosyltransferase|nr:hypothetical protein [bacterium]
MKYLSNSALVLLFIGINIALLFFSYEGATFIEGADASQYYLPALSFLENEGFRRGDTLLTFGPPLYSIFLALPIGLFGLENSATAIVIFQCILLFATGYLFRLILLSFYSGSNQKLYALLLHALIVFNPNSLITAHLVQSETLFTFLLSAALLTAVRLFDEFSLKNLIFLGLFTGLATLTRPVSLYLLIVWPIFLWAVMLLKGRKVNVIRLVAPLLVGLIIISPWYIRNYVEFGKPFYTSNAGAYLKAQYIQLKHKGSGWSRDQAIDRHYIHFKKNILQDENLEKQRFCLQDERGWSCNGSLSHTSLQLILNEPVSAHFKALIDSWGTLFLSGGASNIRNYFGIKGKDAIVGFQTREFKGLESIKDLLKEMNLSYLFIFIVTMLFSVVMRIIGIVGLFYMLKNREFLPYGVFFIEVISLFTAAYLYLGQSRFRVPLEPMLMLLAVVGIIYIVNRRQGNIT